MNASVRKYLAVAGVATAALGLAVFAAFQHELNGHRERIATGSRIVETRCGPVELAEMGSGPPLLLVHGTGGGFDQASSAGVDFAARGLRVIAPSRFGYLRTPYPADASAEAQADHFACLLDTLGISRVAVVGVSAGANSALQFAIRHPQRTSALVLLVPAAYKPLAAPASAPSPSGLTARMLMAIVTSDFAYWFISQFAEETAIRMVLATPPEDFRTASAEEQARARVVLDQILPISARVRGIVNDAHLAGNPPRYALEAIQAATLIISVRNDLYGTYASAQYTAQQIPGARFIGYERGGHAWLGHHHEIMDETAGFVLGAAHATRGGAGH
jgi:pimeloyl-ACP methyl ester carboxylesterase